MTRPGYEFQKEIGGKTFYLVHSGQDFDVVLSGLPASCPSDQGSLALIKLPSATHGWENGQQFVPLPFESVQGDPSRIRFRTPDALRANVPPAYSMMFYVDCMGKPTVARMVRFDDRAKEP